MKKTIKFKLFLEKVTFSTGSIQVVIKHYQQVVTNTNSGKVVQR